MLLQMSRLCLVVIQLYVVTDVKTVYSSEEKSRSLEVGWYQSSPFFFFFFKWSLTDSTAFVKADFCSLICMTKQFTEGCEHRLSNIVCKYQKLRFNKHDPQNTFLPVMSWASRRLCSHFIFVEQIQYKTMLLMFLPYGYQYNKPKAAQRPSKGGGKPV